MISPFTRQFVLAVHGGAGVWRNELTDGRERDGRDAMRAALDVGAAILSSGGTAVDAVEAAVRVLEDAPVFNAGRGSVLTSEGTAEMDAAIMDGATRRAGAIAAVHRIRNPVSAARAVMDRSAHVMMAGAGAEAFAQQLGLQLEQPEYFITPFRLEQWRRLHNREVEGSQRIGTVGAVALDLKGNLAAATSTGGIPDKRFGRVGDSPIIGAGTYADNATCAVSATGHGEYFIRAVVAHDVAALIAYKGLSLQDATSEVIRKVGVLGGNGGLIAVDRAGNVALPFNTEGMFRGVVRSSGENVIAIFPD